MLRKIGFFKKSSQKNFNKTVADANRMCKEIISEKLSHLNIDPDYIYSTSEAMEELGLDNELIHQLLEDYVIQIIKSTLQFDAYLDVLELFRDSNRKLDYTPLRELAHKNLGVARNLRIKNAEIILYELMKKDDIEYLRVCLEALRMCAVKLKPSCAYKTLKLIDVKSSL